jgi:hypothetical protein
MADVVGIAWQTTAGSAYPDYRDLHVLQGQKSRRLDNLLRIFLSDSTSFLANDTSKFAAANITSVQFVPVFPFVLTTHGAAVDPNTGVVSTGTPSGTAFPRNFIITATVMAKVGGATTPTPFPMPIRVHVHSGVTEVHLTPSTLTVRQELKAGVAPSAVSFSIFVVFDDGVIGDVTHNGDPTVPASLPTWQSLSPSTVSVASDGSITALANAGSGSVQVTLPAELGGGQDTGQVLLDDGWSLQRTATAIAGSASTTPGSGVNLLVLPDGFLDGEQTQFEAMVRSLLTHWRGHSQTAPFNKMPLSIFTVWIPSVERGTTQRNLLNYLDRTAGNRKADGAPIPRVPTLKPLRTIQELIYQVGLPTWAERTAPFSTKLAEWQQIYDTPAGTVRVGAIAQTLYDQWAALADYTLAFERNTAFGLANGHPPQVFDVDDNGRVVTWHQGRTQRADVDKLIGSLVDSTGAGIPSSTWLTGVNRTFVIILTAGGHFAGGRTFPPSELIASGIEGSTDVKLADSPGTGRSIADLKSYDLPSRVSLKTVARVTHEKGHALTLGDEYGGGANISDSALVNARLVPNLQADADVRDASGIEGNLISWAAWPRIKAAGLVIATPTGVNPNYTVTVSAGHGRFFSSGDVVRLRLRPFYGPTTPVPPDTTVHLQYLTESIDFTVASVTPNPAGDQVALTVKGAGTFTPASWTANNAILFTPDDTFMVHELVVQAINASHAPLNRTAAACTPGDRNTPQLLAGPIATLKSGQPKNPSWIVGIYDGGAAFYCGVYHPRGSCLMRSLQVTDAQSAPGLIRAFCPVCRYILADRVDPSLHGDLNADYAKYYPVAK